MNKAESLILRNNVLLRIRRAKIKRRKPLGTILLKDQDKAR